MEQYGYMVVQLGKRLNLHLWVRTLEEAEEVLADLQQSHRNPNKFCIAPPFKEDSRRYLEIDSQLLRIE